MPDAISTRPLGYRVLTIASLLGAFGLVLLIGLRWYAYQWDFHMFVDAARDFANGVSPYRGFGLSFYHPPLTLYGYSLFTHLPVWAATTLWYALKLVALWGLLTLWNAHFVKLRADWPTILFLVLAYDGAVYADLVSGNVSTFEELLIWLGFYQLMRQRYGLFSLCIILAAQVKITPILFAALLLIATERPQWKWFLLSVLGFCAVFSLNYWLQPTLFRNFLTVSSHLDERGVDCTSTLALVRDILDHARGSTFSDHSRLDEASFLVLVAAVGLQSLRALLRYRAQVRRIDTKLLICFSCVVFVLVSPRFKVYSYILLVVPTLLLLRARWRSLAVPLAAVALVALVIFPETKSLLPIRYGFQLFNDYLPLVACFAVWLGYLGFLREPAVGEAAAQSWAARWLPPPLPASGDGGES